MENIKIDRVESMLLEVEKSKGKNDADSYRSLIDRLRKSLGIFNGLWIEEARPIIEAAIDSIIENSKEEDERQNLDDELLNDGTTWMSNDELRSLLIELKARKAV
jgi:hypothetical protein